MDKALKQRLVGAVVLIALAVIVLPMLFGGRPDGAGGVDARSIELPTAPPDLDFETRRFPVGNQPVAPNPGAADADPDKDENVADSPPIPPLPEPRELPPGEAPEASETVELAETPVDAAEESAPEAAPEGVSEDVVEATDIPDPAVAQADGMDALVASLTDTDAPATAPGGDRYLVQVASFGNRDNATRLASSLEEGGFNVLLDTVSSDSGDLNRVRVGPYGSEPQAQAAAEALRAQDSGLNPRIVDMQPDAAGPALASEDPLMRWVVQVGSFSSQENATSLVSRLREAGLSAFDERVTSAGSTIYRVRVGPFIDRTDALTAEQKITADFGINGVVMSSD